jgi:hypothetical protein
MKRSLYEISSEIDELREVALEQAQENDGILPDYIANVLDKLDGEKADKVEAIGCVYKDINNFVESIKTEQARLTKMKKVHENEMSRIKSYLEFILSEGEKYKTPKATISWRKSTSTILNDGVEPEDLDVKYQNIKITPALTEIAKGIKAGDEEITKQAKLVSKNSVTIK